MENTDLGLELRLFWGEVRVAEHLLLPSEAKRFSVGGGAGCDFAMGGSKFDAVTSSKDGYSVHFTERMKGELTRGDETINLAHAIASGQAEPDGEAYSVQVNKGDYLWVDLGGIVMEAIPQRAPRRVAVPVSETIDYPMLNLFLGLFFMAALFVITSLNREAEGDEYADELSSNSAARIVSLMVKPPPEPQKNKFLDQLAKQKEQQASEMAAKHAGPEGAAGRKDAQPKNARMAPKGKRDERDHARQMVSGILGSQGISSVFGSGMGGELTAAMGGLRGPAAGDSRGFGGMSLRGTESGGGGVDRTIGIGAIGTRGRASGSDEYGNGYPTIGGKKITVIDVVTSEVGVTGSLDRDLVRGVVRSHHDQIRYCYETQLPRAPNLAGKVSVKFYISGAGSVATSQVDQSTVNNPQLEACVVDRVRTWQFPKPKGGGVVIVTYPFLFKQSGE